MNYKRKFIVKIILLLGISGGVLIGLQKLYDQSSDVNREQQDQLLPQASNSTLGQENMPNQESNVLINEEGMTLETRIQVPEGYVREAYEGESFEAFVRNYPMKEHGLEVKLYDGTPKRNQDAHIAIFDMTLGDRDLQQCADSIMRMYAEYFYSTEQWDKIQFQFVNGFLCEYDKWREGYRVKFDGNDTSWVKSAEYDPSEETFEKYLEMVYSYSSTLSMAQESVETTIEALEIGDIWLKSGSPGHVVMVVDVCQNETGEKAFLLAQGYMPAQEFHVLKNPRSEEDPWYYEWQVTYPFQTPEYRFDEGQLRRLHYR